MTQIESAVDELREQLVAERVATGALTAQVAAHELRGEERHRELLTHLAAMREDHRQAFTGAVKITLAVIGVLSTAIGGYFSLAGR